MAGEQTSKLTLLAQALGFDASAKAVDVLAAAEAKLAATTKNLEDTKLTGTVADVEKLRTEQQGLASAIGELQPEQERLNARTQDYIGLLNQVHPALGQLVQGMTRGVKVASELATENLSLKGAFEAVTGAIKNNLGAVALLGAGGIAVAGFQFLLSQIEKVRQQAEAAADAMKKMKEAQTDLEVRDIGAVEDIVAARAANRRLRPFSFEETEAVRRTFEGTPEALRGKMGPLLVAFGGSKTFEAGGPFLSTELEALIQLGFQPDELKSQRGNEIAARRLLQRRAPDLERIRNAEALRRETLRRRAAQEARDTQSAEGAGHLRLLAEEIAKNLGVDPDKLVQEVIGETRLREEFRKGGGGDSLISETLEERIRQSREDLTPTETQGVIELQRKIGGSPISMNIHNEYHQQGWRNVGPSAAQQRLARNNGEAHLAGVELGFA